MVYFQGCYTHEEKSVRKKNTVFYKFILRTDSSLKFMTTKCTKHHQVTKSLISSFQSSTSAMTYMCKYLWYSCCSMAKLEETFYHANNRKLFSFTILRLLTWIKPELKYNVQGSVPAGFNRDNPTMCVAAFLLGLKMHDIFELYCLSVFNNKAFIKSE